MESEAFIAWGVRPELRAALLLMACLASYVALDMTRRIPANHGRASGWWLGGGALALGTGLW